MGAPRHEDRLRERARTLAHRRGLGGNDVLRGRGGNDTLDGGPGSDLLEGGRGTDFLLGGPGDDRLLARDGVREDIDGGAGRDSARIDANDWISLIERVL